MADPNWIYSTLAQASATIAGVFAGFLTSRALADYGLGESQARELERAYWHAMRDFLEMGWHPSMKAGFLRHAASGLRTGGGEYPWFLRDQAIQHGMTPVLTPSAGFADSLDSIADFLELISSQTRDFMPRQIPTDRATWASEKKIFDALGLREVEVREGIESNKSLSDVDKNILTMYLAQEWEPVTNFQMLYRGLESDYSRFADTLNGRPYYFGLAIFLFMSVTTVVWPMTRLSAYSPNDRMLFLILLSVGLLVFTAYVGGLIARLRGLRSIGQQNEGLALWETMSRR